jgi:tyrosine/nicotianamine family aminotransferase
MSIRFADLTTEAERRDKTIKYMVVSVHCGHDALIPARFRVACRSSEIEYAIRDMLAVAKEVERSGKKVIYLNIGDPAKFDFQPPPHIRRALAKAVDAGCNYYAASEGIPELREAVAEKEKRVNSVPISSEDVIVTSGISEGIQFLMGAIVQPGDEILVPGPTYPPYISFVKYFGGIPVAYRTIEDNDWLPDLDDLRNKITSRTRAMVIVNPNNPTGSLYDGQTLKKMLDIAAEYKLLVASDEIYDRLVYDSKFTSTAALAKDVPVVGLNGFSKTYVMTGWRLGYLYFHDPAATLKELKEAIAKESRIRISSATPMQYAAVKALKGSQKSIITMARVLKKRRDHFLHRIRSIDGLTCTTPKGAFYLFPRISLNNRWKSDKDFAIDLVKKTGVLVVNGSGFDQTYGAGHFRTVFLPPIDVIDEAADRIERFMRS